MGRTGFDKKKKKKIQEGKFCTKIEISWTKVAGFVNERD